MSCVLTAQPGRHGDDLELGVELAGCLSGSLLEARLRLWRVASLYGEFSLQNATHYKTVP